MRPPPRPEVFDRSWLTEASRVMNDQRLNSDQTTAIYSQVIASGLVIISQQLDRLIECVDAIEANR